MSFDALETSIEDGQPIELYSFESAVYSFYYTNNHDAVVYGGNTYLPLQIERDTIQISAVTVSPYEFNIRMPRDCDFADLYSKPFSPPDLRVRVRRRHRGDSETRLLFIGETIRYNPLSGGIFEVTSVSKLQMLLNRRMQANRYNSGKCVHELYDNRCKVVKADFTYTTTVAALPGPTNQYIEVANDHVADEFLRLGDIIINGEYRLILSNFANVIKVRYPFTEIEVGMPVTLVKGCLHTKRMCINDFDNIVNFGGNPLSPSVNVAKAKPDTPPFVNIMTSIF
jgi:hypothetical protein